MGTQYRHLGSVTLWGNICVTKTGDTSELEAWQDVKLAHSVHISADGTSHDHWLPVLWPEIDAIARKHNWHGATGKVGTLYAEPYHYSSLLRYMEGLADIQNEVGAMVQRYAQMIHETSVMAKILEVGAK